MDEIWTGCERQKQTLVDSGVKVPIFVFPQPIITEKLDIYKPYKLPFFKGFLFYSIFEWIERKNPEALLTAFYEEFGKSEPVGLLIKTYRNTFSEDKKAYVRKAIRELKPDGATAARVFLYEDLMNEAEIYRLHATGDCFVSTHRGEGWGRPQMEAMVMSKPIISTKCGGIHEYLSESEAYLLPWEKTPVTLDEGNISYEEGQNWADVDIGMLRKTMRYVFEHQKEAQTVGIKGHDFVVAHFTPMIVGTMMKERLIEIEKTL
jgi:glycosyltransferase involved in cell wall biosynthesis